MFIVAIALLIVLLVVLLRYLGRKSELKWLRAVLADTKDEGIKNSIQARIDEIKSKFI